MFAARPSSYPSQGEHGTLLVRFLRLFSRTSMHQGCQNDSKIPHCLGTVLVVRPGSRTPESPRRADGCEDRGPKDYLDMAKAPLNNVADVGNLVSFCVYNSETREEEDPEC